jgi:hypothetical protein
MSKALKRKQNLKTNIDVTDNSFEKVVKKVIEDRNVSKGPSSSILDDEEFEVFPKKKFQNNSKKEVKVISIKNIFSVFE